VDGYYTVAFLSVFTQAFAFADKWLTFSNLPTEWIAT